jgi:hypothetical protein
LVVTWAGHQETGAIFPEVVAQGLEAEVAVLAVLVVAVLVVAAPVEAGSHTSVLYEMHVNMYISY